MGCWREIFLAVEKYDWETSGPCPGLSTISVIFIPIYEICVLSCLQVNSVVVGPTPFDRDNGLLLMGSHFRTGHLLMVRSTFCLY